MLNEFLTKIKTREFARPNRFTVDIIIPENPEFSQKLRANEDSLQQETPNILNVINKVKNPKTLSPRSILDVASEQLLDSANVFRDPSYAISKAKDIFSGGQLEPTENSVMLRRLRFSCESVELPGKSFSTADINEYGPIYNIPYQQIYDNTSITFRVSSDAFEKKFFDAWQDLIADTQTNDLNFYENYISVVQITQYNRSGKEIYKIKLKEAFPVTVNSIALDHNTADDIVRLNVEMSYRYWERLI